MYQITKDFVDDHVYQRYCAEKESEKATTRVESADFVLDLRAECLEIAMTLAKLKDALFDDHDESLKATLMKSVSNMRDRVDELSGEMLVAEATLGAENVSTDEAVVLAIANYNLGLIRRLHPNEEEALVLDSKEYFLRCGCLLDKRKTEPKAVITLMKVYDQLHEIWWHLNNYLMQNIYLNKMVELYILYVEQHTRKPIDLAIELGIEKSLACKHTDLTNLDEIFLHSFAAYMDMYAMNKQWQPSFVACLHRILQDQLPKMFTYDAVAAWEWISTLCDMSTYFMECNRFVEAKNYIATAEHILKIFYDWEITKGKEEWSDAELRYLRARHDFMRCVISRFWGIYGLEFLAESGRNQMLHVFSGDASETNLAECTDKDMFANKPLAPLLFADIEGTMSDSVRKIRTKTVCRVDDAKEVFLTILNNLNAARQTCFSAKTNFRIYTNITIEMSKAYKYLANFEQGDKKRKLHTKRLLILLELKDKCVGLSVISSLCLYPEEYESRSEDMEKYYLHLTLAYYSLLDNKFDDEIYTIIGAETPVPLSREIIREIIYINECLNLFVKTQDSIK